MENNTSCMEKPSKSSTEPSSDGQSYLQEVLARCAESASGSIVSKSVLASEKKLRERQIATIEQGIQKGWMEQRANGKTTILQITESGRKEYEKNLPPEKKLSRMQAEVQKITIEMEKCVGDVNGVFASVNTKMSLIEQGDMERALQETEKRYKDMIGILQEASSTGAVAVSLQNCISNVYNAYVENADTKTNSLEKIRKNLDRQDQEYNAFATNIEKEMKQLSWLAAQCKESLQKPEEKTKIQEAKPELQEEKSKIQEKEEPK